MRCSLATSLAFRQLGKDHGPDRVMRQKLGNSQALAASCEPWAAWRAGRGVSESRYPAWAVEYRSTRAESGLSHAARLVEARRVATRVRRLPTRHYAQLVQCQRYVHEPGSRSDARICRNLRPTAAGARIGCASRWTRPGFRAGISRRASHESRVRDLIGLLGRVRLFG